MCEAIATNKVCKNPSKYWVQWGVPNLLVCGVHLAPTIKMAAKKVRSDSQYSTPTVKTKINSEGLYV